jgi:hypothetical protein
VAAVVTSDLTVMARDGGLSRAPPGSRDTVLTPLSLDSGHASIQTPRGTAMEAP